MGHGCYAATHLVGECEQAEVAVTLTIIRGGVKEVQELCEDCTEDVVCNLVDPHNTYLKPGDSFTVAFQEGE